MKKNLYFLILIVSLICLNSCSESSNGLEDNFSVSTTSIGIKKSITSASFNVICDKTWTADISGSWATISPNVGTGNGSISIKTTTNNTGEKRYCTVSVQSGSKTLEVEVVQAYY